MTAYLLAIVLVAVRRPARRPVRLVAPAHGNGEQPKRLAKSPGAIGGVEERAIKGTPGDRPVLARLDHARCEVRSHHRSDGFVAEAAPTIQHATASAPRQGHPGTARSPRWSGMCGAASRGGRARRRHAR